jgi:hypothetical protein
MKTGASLVLVSCRLRAATAPARERTTLLVDGHDLLYRAGTTRVLPRRTAARPAR